MMNWESTLVSGNSSIVDAMRVLDGSGLQILIVVDRDRKLLGTVTDGDIRRAILGGKRLDEAISTIMARECAVGREGDSEGTLLGLMRQKELRHIPILDQDGRVVGLRMLIELLKASRLDNWVVLMAGGLGTRLKPLTESLPKPLVRVGPRPLLETTIETFREQGFCNFFLSVNYLAEMIEDYFGDGSRWGVSISYLRERTRLGTAGALALLPEKPSKPFLVMNGDILTKLDFKSLLEFHEHHQADAVMCTSEHQFQIPYGVVETEGIYIKSLVEKPTQKCFINAGIYSLSPDVLNYIPRDTFFDMPSLFTRVTEEGKKGLAFPIREYWLDIGRMSDYERAVNDFHEHFDT